MIVNPPGKICLSSKCSGQPRAGQSAPLSSSSPTLQKRLLLVPPRALRAHCYWGVLRKWPGGLFHTPPDTCFQKTKPARIWTLQACSAVRKQGQLRSRSLPAFPGASPRPSLIQPFLGRKKPNQIKPKNTPKPSKLKISRYRLFISITGIG